MAWYNEILNFSKKDKVKNPSFSMLDIALFRNAKDKEKEQIDFFKQQLLRVKQDIQKWRQATNEAEQLTPWRVEMQRIFQDTVLNAQVSSAMEKRKNRVLLKDFELYASGEESEALEELFQEKWFTDFLSYTLDAIFYGYQLIQLGSIKNNSFEGIKIYPRERISPDRLIFAQKNIYALDGVKFLEEPYKDWIIYVTTPSENGQSPCGYGILNKVAPYEIWCRNALGAWNDYQQLFGMPVRLGKTNTRDETMRQQMADMMAQMGTAAWGVVDNEDEVQLIDRAGSGNTQSVYSELVKTCNDYISKIILGHTAAMDATAGKLGSETNALESLEDFEAKDCKFAEHVVNTQLIPRMQKFGLIPQNVVFKFSNSKEEDEKKEKENENLKNISTYVKTFSDAGFEVPVEWIEEKTGIKMEKKEVQPVTNAQITNKLNDLYR